MKKRIITFLKLPLNDKIIFTIALILLPTAQVCILTLSLPRLLKLFKLKQCTAYTSIHLTDEQKRTICSVSKNVFKASQIVHFPRPRCLAQGLTTHLILRFLKIQTVILLGIHKHNGSFLAHAWLRFNTHLAYENEMFDNYSIVAAFTSQTK